MFSAGTAQRRTSPRYFGMSVSVPTPAVTFRGYRYGATRNIHPIISIAASSGAGEQRGRRVEDPVPWRGL